MGKKWIALLLAVGAFYACKKEQVGFLQTEYAGYAPDSLVMKAVLDTTYTMQFNDMYGLLLSMGFTKEQLADPKFTFYWIKGPVPDSLRTPNNPEDYNRNQFKVPWITIPIQGLRGTFPLEITVSKIIPASPEADKLRQQITVRGASGIMQIPLNHGVKPGRYTLSLRFSNEGWVKEKENVFTFIIE